MPQAFRAVYSERSVSRAAIRLGLSQPAVSHALAKLRIELRDPLFMRIPGGVAPTAKADRLAAVVTPTLQALEMAVQEVNHFDPARSKRTFRLYMTFRRMIWGGGPIDEVESDLNSIDKDLFDRESSIYGRIISSFYSSKWQPV